MLNIQYWFSLSLKYKIQIYFVHFVCFVAKQEHIFS